MPGAILLGVSGWSYQDWEGLAYPSPKPKGFDALAYIAPYVDFIEINSTFYNPSSEKNARSWVARTRDVPDFCFAVKLWQKLSHETDWTVSDLSAARVVPDALAAEGMLAACLLQFPWSFKRDDDNRRRLGRLADELAGLPLAVEFRHSSWDRPEVYEAFLERGIAFVNIDQPVIGAALGPTDAVTAGFGYCRLHGRNLERWIEGGRDDRYNYLYKEEELRPWAERLRKMAEECGVVYLAANNHFKAKALVNRAQLGKLLGQKVRVPPPLREGYPLLVNFTNSE